MVHSGPPAATLLLTLYQLHGTSTTTSEGGLVIGAIYVYCNRLDVLVKNRIYGVLNIE